jgi:hypothetical protein
MEKSYSELEVPFAIRDLVQALPFVDSHGNAPQTLPELQCLSDSHPVDESTVVVPLSSYLRKVQRF